MTSFTTVVLAALCLSAVSAHTSIVRKDAASDAVAKAFVDKIVKAVSAHNEAELSGLFADSFVYTGCAGTYNKAAVLTMLEKIPAGTSLPAEVVSSRFCDGNDVRYTVQTSSIGAGPITAEFKIHNNQLVEGKTVKC